jgi:copper chaperone CopZ
MRIRSLSFFTTPLLLLALYGLNSCATKVDAKVAEIKLPTLQCGSCVRTVSAALKEVDGVHEVNVDLEAKNAQVTYDAGKTDVAGLATAVAASGYAANEVEADPKAYEKLATCCKVPE